MALGAACAYGLSDFLGGLVSRRASVWSVTLVTQIASLTFVGIAALGLPGRPTPADLAWGGVAGIGTGTGTVFLYRGLAAGRMGVVAPVSAVAAALLPVAVGVLTGDRPPVLTWIGIACAVPAIWLVSGAPGAAGRGRIGDGVVDGLLAGIGFGVLFSALGQVAEGSGIVPLAAEKAISIPTVVALATIMGVGRAWIPRERSAWWGLIVGALGALGAGLFLLATQAGMLTVSAVLSSLYPVVTVLLAATLLRERIHATQALGLGLAATAVALVALG